MIVRVNVRKLSRNNARGKMESDLKIETEIITIARVVTLFVRRYPSEKIIGEIRLNLTFQP